VERVVTFTVVPSFGGGEAIFQERKTAGIDELWAGLAAVGRIR